MHPSAVPVINTPRSDVRQTEAMLRTVSSTSADSQKVMLVMTLIPTIKMQS